MKLNVSHYDETDKIAFICKNEKRMYKDIETFYHCYQRPLDRGVIFYSRSDHLLYFTIYCIKAARYKISPLKLVQMQDHIHHSIIEKEARQLGSFLKDVTSTFTREYNHAWGRKGLLFERPFGRAPKYKDKSIRSNLTYLDNNPVERHLVDYAEQYRWNYLAYANSNHPFSEKIVLRYASMPLRRALKAVEDRHKRGKYLTCKIIQNLFRSLPSNKECEQLTDFIISTYSIIDHAASVSYFKSYKDELTAAHATTGSEHDLKETFNGKSDRYYNAMTKILLDAKEVKDIHEVYTMSIEQKRRCFDLLKRKTVAPWRQITSFLHYPVEE